MSDLTKILPQQVEQSLRQLNLPAGASFLLAYSGGLDSHCLLDIAVRLELPLRVAHVHHGLQAQADAWAQHCRQVCKQHDLSFIQLDVDARPGRRQSPEEAARKVRYQALAEALRPGECLLTAQHQDDQAETLLLQLLRGAGNAGLAAMPVLQRFAAGWHARPLLDISRNELQAYAQQRGLQWVEDPSNEDEAYARNFLRHRIMPLLQQRYRQLARSLSQVAARQGESLSILDDMAAIDLADALRPAPQPGLSHQVLSCLSLPRLVALSPERRRNLLRYWIQQKLDMPASASLLQSLERDLLPARRDSSPLVGFHGYHFRRYHGLLYLLKAADDFSAERDFKWRPASEPVLSLPGTGLQLQACSAQCGGLSPELLQKTLRLRFSHAGGRFQPQGRAHSQTLKKLLQQAGIPPWERTHLPLLYDGNELIAVAMPAPDRWQDGMLLMTASAGHAVADTSGWVPALLADSR